MSVGTTTPNLLLCNLLFIGQMPFPAYANFCRCCCVVALARAETLTTRFAFYFLFTCNYIEQNENPHEITLLTMPSGEDGGDASEFRRYAFIHLVSHFHHQMCDPTLIAWHKWFFFAIFSLLVVLIICGIVRRCVTNPKLNKKCFY